MHLKEFPLFNYIFWDQLSTITVRVPETTVKWTISGLAMTDILQRLLQGYLLLDW